MGKNWFFAALLSTTALSTLGDVPASVMPSDVADSFKEAPDFLSSPQPVIQEGGSDAKADVDAKKFVLTDVTLNNLPLTADATFADMVSPLLGTEVTFQELRALAATLTKHYREQGYILNRVVLPPQKIEDGRVHFHLVEGKIVDVEVVGDAWLMEGRIQHYIDRILAATPLTQEVYERNILLLDDLPGIEVKASLVPAKKGQEGTKLILELRQIHVDFSTQVNNDGTKYIGPWQGQATVKFNNLLRNNESFAIGYGAAPTKNGMKVTTFQFTQPIGSDGLTLRVDGQTSRSHPTNVLAPLRMYGSFEKMAIALDYMLWRMKHRSLRVGVNFSWKNSENTTRLTDTTTKDRLRIIGATIQYDFSDQWRGQNIITASLSQGIRGMGATKEDATNKSRNSGKTAFTKVEAMVMRNQVLPNNFRMQGVIMGQLASRPLTTPERFGIGGPPYNKSYPLSAFNGDAGVQAKLEIGYIWQGVPLTEYVMPYAYYTYGKVWNRKPEAGEKKSQHVAGMNFGIRSELRKDLSVFTEYACPFDKKINNKKFNNKLYAGINYRVKF